MDYFSKPKTLIASRRIFCTHKESKETSEIEFKVWRLESSYPRNELQLITYLCNNSLLGIPSVVQGFNDMDGLAKCIREIDSFLMAYLIAYDLTFESSFPYSYSNGSAFFDETVLKLRELTAHRERGGDQPT